MKDVVALMAIGQIASKEGHFQYRDGLGACSDVGWLPPGHYLKRQPPDLPVFMRHDDDWRLGSAVYFERSQRDGLLAALSITSDIKDLLDDGPWYLSPGIRSDEPTPRRLERAQMREVSLTRTPANTGTRPLVYARANTALPPAQWSDTWERAKAHVAATKYRLAPKAIEIVDLDELSAHDLFISDRAAWKKGAAEVEAARRRAAADAAKREPVGTVHRHSLGGRIISFS